MKIVLTGSLGNIGKPLAEMLVADGHLVTVISSNLEKASDIKKIGGVAAIGAVTDSHFLEKTFAGADSVFCMTPSDHQHQDEFGYYQNIAHSYKRAIIKSGVCRVVYLSSNGANLATGTGFIKGSYYSEQLLNEIPNIYLTHIRPGFFYQNFFGFAAMVKFVGFIGAAYGGDDKVVMASPKDVAELIAEELVKPHTFQLVRYVASDDRTCNEIASVLGNAVGIPDLKWNTLPEDEAIDALRHSGMMEEVAMNFVELGGALHSGKLREDFDAHGKVEGRVKLEDFAPEFADVFKAIK